ncbi:hypothetical protein KSD_48750 [Ktedonobacter sp. SOSP1-85]|uniref:hypothetical protein n=1 Tax=Ktedonobacter sp. SOSP1-85 TaxID=2778367 RepID=UPI001916309E|nr:hypothetical protein [Ktedonobacter sp. SOSP1-85]GHO77104.1 hypothetical protein KSD_48750 [Ktedonobacter sp. SOSP1-85]
MMNKLRGRNLKHPGCLIGVTTGLTVGIILAGVMAAVFNINLSVILWSWLIFIVVLGVIGWVIGDRMSSRFPALEEETAPSQADASPPQE